MQYYEGKTIQTAQTFCHTTIMYDKHVPHAFY